MRGYLDSATFFRRVGGPGGFLAVSGWASLTDGGARPPLVAEIRAGRTIVRFPCDLPRPDVAAADPRCSEWSGFDAVIPVADVVVPAMLSIDIMAEGRACGSLSGPIICPEQHIAAIAPRLTRLHRIKLENLVLNERERLSRVTRTRSLPVTGQIDPSFGCNLRCPLCLSEMARRDGYRLPTLRLDQLDRILAQYGDCLVRIWLSLWGEPLLNKDLPAMIARCKQRDIWVLISSNMSVPLKPHATEDLVRSGLDSIILSIDGATQATYSRYRQGGSLDLALDNVRQLVAAKRALGSPTPHLYWRYLTFAWNRHEVEQARQLAASLGVDEFGTSPGVLTPETRHDFTPRVGDQEAAQVGDRLLANWRRHAAERRRRTQWFGCDYHYASISINSDGLVHPCCYVVSPAHAIGSATDPVDQLRNGPVMRDNRAMFAAVGTDEQTGPRGHEPCASCSTIDATCGHIVTQTNFRQLYGYLVNGRPMRW